MAGIGLGVRIGNRRVGASLFPTEGLQWSQYINEAFAVNSGTGLDFVSANGDYVQLSETITLSGDFEVRGTVRMVGSSRFLSNNNGGNYIRTDNIGGTLHITFQLGGFIQIPTTKSWASGDVVSFIARRLGNSYSVEIDGSIGTSVTGSTGNFIAEYIYRSSAAYYSGSIYVLQMISGNGDSYSFDFFQTAGNTLYSREYATTGLTGTINGAAAISGSPFGEQLYDWGYNYYTTGGVLDNVNGTVLITGATPDALVDVKGNTIAYPAIEKTYNAPNIPFHYTQIEENVGSLIDTSGDMTVAFWINPNTGGFIFDNGPCFAVYDAGTSDLTFTRDNTNLLAYNETLDGWEFYAIVSDNAGLTTIYKGDLDTDPVAVVTNQSAGTPTSAAVQMLANNDVNLATHYDGYNRLVGFWNRQLTIEEITTAYNHRKSELAFFF